jgi:hypothetical protein
LLRFFQSIFRKPVKPGAYPESLVKAAIERAVDGTDPCIRAVSGYRKKLRPAVLHAIDHVVGMVDATGASLPLDPAQYGENEMLRTFFVSAADVGKFVERDPALMQFRKGVGGRIDGASALLVMEKQEKTVMGAVMSGDVVMRDVPQTTVSFDRHRLMDVAAQEEETRRQVKKRAYDHLLRLALGRIAEVKTRRGKLERHRTLLRSKLDLLQRGGWGFDDGTGEQLDAPAIEKLLGQIEGELLEIGREDRMFELYLNIVADVLAHAEEHVWARKEPLSIDRMGIKRKAAGEAGEVDLEVMGDSAGRSLVVSLVTIPSP